MLTAPSSGRPAWLAIGTLALAAALPAALSQPARPAPPVSPASSASPEATRLGFGWPTSGTVSVTEDVDRQGLQLRMTYTLRLSPHGSEGGVRVAHADFVVESMNGKAVKPGTLDGFALLAQARPDFVVTKAGKFGGIVDYDAMVARVMSGQAGEQAPTIGKMLSSPRYRAVLERNTVERWTFWVALWAGLRVRPGETTSLAGGASTLNVKETPGGPAGTLRLKMVTVNRGEDARRAAIEAAQALASKSGRAEVAADAVESVEARDDVQVVTWPDGLRPLRVLVSNTSRVKMRGRAAAEHTEQRAWRFAWGAKAP